MSTFLENGSILLKCRRRFMVFDPEGNFICEVTFNNGPMDDNESEDDDVSELSEEQKQEDDPEEA